MKKAFLIISGILLFLVVAIASIPFLFKDKIIAKIKSEVSNTIDAKVDFKDVSLSLFSNFPNLSVTLEEVEMLGVKDGFKNDTLFKSESLKATVDIMTVISGEKIKVKGVYLDKPYILTKFTKDGRMSWDITKTSPGDTIKEEPTEPSNFTIAIENWEINEGTIIYDDRSLPMYVELRKVNHSGSGEMAGDIFTMDTKTKSPEFYVSYDNVTYLNKHELDADAKLKLDLAKSEYSFLENKFKINDFVLHFDGLIAMPTDDIQMDLKFKAEETKFKTLLSLVPKDYLKDFENIKTDGDIAFDGWAKGIYNDTILPGFGVNLLVNKAMLQYPNLTPVSNIEIDMHVLNNGGSLANTQVTLNKFNADLGTNPIRAKGIVKGIGPMDINANLKATLNLSDVSKFYPIEGLTLAGVTNLDITAVGVYDDSLKKMPMVNAKMNLANGYVKSKDIPFPLEKVNFNLTANSDGNLSTSNVLLENFKMTLDGEPFELRAFVENFDNIYYDVNLKGIVDLYKMTQIYPIEGTTLAGRINTDITSKGRMSDIQSGAYDKTSTSGTMEITNLKFKSKDFPQGMSLNSANFTLNPQSMTIANLDGTVGRSDISLKGQVSNYMGYLFGGKNTKDTVLHGSMALISKKIDVNEWLTVEEVPAAKKTEADIPLTVFEVPKDIDFLFSSTIGKVLYDSLTLSDMKGNIVAKDGIVRMENLSFNTLGGGFLVNGNYNTQDIKKPTFDAGLMITDFSLKQAYTSLEMVRKFAPVAGNMEGNFSTELKIGGVLGQDMMPKYNTINGLGKIFIASAQLKDNKVLDAVAGLTQIKNLAPMAVKDLVGKMSIVNGNVIIEPLDIKLGNIKMNLGGKQALDGAMDFLLKMDLPAGNVGSAINNSIAKLSGHAPTENENVKFDLKITGTYKAPKVTLDANSLKAQIKNALMEKAEAEKERLRKEAEEKLKAEIERIKKEADAKIKAEQERIKKQAEERAKAELEKKKQELIDKLNQEKKQ